MCGIAGILQLDGTALPPPVAERMGAMLETLRERGPDAAGTWSGDGAVLGHRRLRIIDLSPEADQPMISHSGDQVVVFNGEIYNHHSLRSDLEARGHRFRTRADTEVLLHGYQEWGEDLVHRLSGMFALALLDRPARRLLLARDRVGKKPLYYGFAAAAGGAAGAATAGAAAGSAAPGGPTRFLFGSNVKCVVAGLDGVPDIDYAAVYDYLGLFSVPEERCIYRGIAKLPAAHYAVLDMRERTAAGDRLRLQRYWTPKLRPKIRWNAAALHRVEETLRDAVGRRLESDVPLAVFLSGGIDSSLVTAYAAAERPGITTISARFEQASHDESAYARAVADRFKTDHHEVPVRASSLDVVPELVWQYGEPFADSSSIAQYEIAKAARELATVVLTGDGGDELFGGYRRYTLAAAQIWLRERVPESVFGAGKRAGSCVGGMLPGSWRDLATRGFDRAPDPIRGALGALDPANPPYFLFHTWFLDRDRLLSPEFKERLAGGGPLGRGAGAHGAPAGGVTAGGATAAPADWPTDPECLPGDSAQGWPYPSPASGSCDDLSPFDRLLLADLAYWLPADMLTKVDVATMAASIEARSPLLDHEMVELAALLDWRGKVGARRLKKALRELAARTLPPEVVKKPKWGFVVPVDHWIRGEAQPLFREVLLGEIARSRGLFDYAYVEQVLDAHCRGAANHKHRLWSLFALELWFRMFVDGSLSRGDRLEAPGSG